MFSIERAIQPFAPLADPGSRRLVIKDAMIISMDRHLGNLAEADILVEGNTIAAIAPSLPTDDAEILDARGMIVIPGFIDCHRHAWEAQLRHLNPNSSNLVDYCCATHFSFAPHYRPIDIYAATLLTAVGGIDHGITTFIDNAHNARTQDHAEAGLRAWLDSGVRSVYAPGPPLIGEWDEEHWPHAMLERLSEKLASAGSRLTTLGVMSQFDKQVWNHARGLNIPIVTEVVSPAMADTIRQFAREGLLGPDNIFNHVTGMPQDVLRLLQSAGVGVNVCPRSDTQYGIVDGGMGAFQAALDAGLKPGFSIDNETSYGGDMFGEMRTELSLQRAMTQRDRFEGKANVAPPLSVTDVLEAATISGARCAALDSRVGSIAIGKDADLTILDARHLNLLPLNNALGAVVQGAERSNIDTVIIGGVVRKRNGKILGLDEAKLASLVSGSRDYLLQSYGYRPDPFCNEHKELLSSEAAINRYWQ